MHDASQLYAQGVAARIAFAHVWLTSCRNASSNAARASGAWPRPRWPRPSRNCAFARRCPADSRSPNFAKKSTALAPSAATPPLRGDLRRAPCLVALPERFVRFCLVVPCGGPLPLSWWTRGEHRVVVLHDGGPGVVSLMRPFHLREGLRLERFRFREAIVVSRPSDAEVWRILERRPRASASASADFPSLSRRPHAAGEHRRSRRGRESACRPPTCDSDVPIAATTPRRISQPDPDLHQP